MGRTILKNWLVVVLLFAVIPSACPSAYGQPWDGNGTAEDPYLVYTASQMMAVGNRPGEWEDCFKLMADIDLKGLGFKMIGTQPVFGAEGISLDISSGKMYITDSKAVKRANLDGSAIEVLLDDLKSPTAIAVDVLRRKMYWGERWGETIERANLDGSDRETVIGAAYTKGIALDLTGGKIYWTDMRNHKVRRANLDGSGLEDLIVDGVNMPRGIALDVDGDKMYWTNRDKIQRANLDGSGIEDLVVAGLGWPAGIEVDPAGGKIYWTDGINDNIERANLDGTSREELVSGLSSPDGIAIDTAGGKMYWTSSGIVSANLDGSGQDDLIRSYFRGVFDGDGHVISNFAHEAPWWTVSTVGLFAHLRGEDAVIKNLGLLGPYVEGGSNAIGTLVGRVHSGSVVNCWAEGGSVSTGGGSVGGLIGSNSGKIINCHSTVSILDKNGKYGGLVGRNSGSITQCSAGGDVSGYLCGGLVLYNHGSITYSFSTGDVVATSFYSGGLVGANDGGTISNCYSWANVLGTNVATRKGGLVGDNVDEGEIVNCYSVGYLTESQVAGGLVGRQSDGSITDSFWDIETSGEANSAGGTGLSTVEMQSESTFVDAGWNFESPIWVIDEGEDYPRLWWELGLERSNVAPIACIVDGRKFVSAWSGCESEVTLDGSCSLDADSTEGTSDDINDFDWYEVIDTCEPNSDIYIGSGEVIECNLGLGEHVIILEVTDKAGEFDRRQVSIWVWDRSLPEIILNGSEMVVLECGVDMYTEEGAEATDLCDDVEVVIGGDIVDTSRCGTYVVTYDAVDAWGNEAEQVTRMVVVEDTTPPEISLVVEPNVLWPPNGKMIEVRPEWEASDNCDEQVEVSLVDISMSPVGDINDYVEIGDDGSIYLRAAKDKEGSGRIYTLVYEAADDSGNVTEASATVTVPHSRGHSKLRERPRKRLYITEDRKAAEWQKQVQK